MRPDNARSYVLCTSGGQTFVATNLFEAPPFSFLTPAFVINIMRHDFSFFLLYEAAGATFGRASVYPTAGLFAGARALGHRATGPQGQRALGVVILKKNYP